MYKFRKLITPLTFSVGLILSTAAVAAPMEHNKPGLRHILAQLDLSQEQRQDIHQLFKDGRADNEMFRQDRQQFRQQLHGLIQSQNWDETTVSELFKGQQQQKTQIALQRAINKHKLWLLLSSEQQIKLSNLIAKNKPEERVGADGLMLLSKLDLNPEQQAQIAELENQMQQDSQNRSSIHQAFAEDEKALLTKPEFDQVAWQNLHESMQNEVLSSAISAAHTRNKVWNLLNDEQQQQLLKLIEAKRKDKKHHHGEHMASPLEI